MIGESDFSRDSHGDQWVTCNAFLPYSPSLTLCRANESTELSALSVFCHSALFLSSGVLQVKRTLDSLVVGSLIGLSQFDDLRMATSG